MPVGVEERIGAQRAGDPLGDTQGGEPSRWILEVEPEIGKRRHNKPLEPGIRIRPGDPNDGHAQQHTT